MRRTLAVFAAIAALAAAATARAPAPEGPATTTLAIGGGEIEIAIVEPAALSQEAIEAWAGRAARALTAFYGRFPVARVRLRIAGGGRGHGISGTTYRGRSIRITFGADATPADLERDWTLTHEFFHLAFPDLDRTHLWMEEGLATYFEPIARARVGGLAPEKVWRDLVQRLPNGLPGDGDRGLDRTATWGRTYWGGAYFWLAADLEIREATANRRSADDALRAILAAGGDGAAHWPIARVLEAGDAATGTSVLTDVYRRLAEQPFTPDLEALWRKLGVVREGRSVRFEDGAPLAAIRRAITDDGLR